MKLRGLHRLNPSYKAVAIIIASFLIAFTYSLTLNIFLCLLSLLALAYSRISLPRLLRIILPLSFVAFGLYFTGKIYSEGQKEMVLLVEQLSLTIDMGTYHGLQLASRTMVFASMGMLFSLTTDPYELVVSLQSDLKLPPQFAYGVLAAMHLFPSIKKEYKASNMALKTRGLRGLKLYTKRLVNTMIALIRWSDQLALAMISRGFSSDQARIFAKKPGFTWQDTCFLIVLPSIVIVLGFIIRPI